MANILAKEVVSFPHQRVYTFSRNSIYIVRELELTQLITNISPINKGTKTYQSIQNYRIVNGQWKYYIKFLISLGLIKKSDWFISTS